jgi:hypothetical protein
MDRAKLAKASTGLGDALTPMDEPLGVEGEGDSKNGSMPNAELGTTATPASAQVEQSWFGPALNNS